MVFSLFKKLFSSDASKEAVDGENVPVDGVAVEPEVSGELAAEGGESRSRRGRGGKNRGGRRGQHVSRALEVQHLSPEEEEKLMNRLQEMVLFIARTLVDEPDKLGAELTEKDGSQVVMISCEKKDAGKLIGRNGRIIAAIRILVSGTAAKFGLKVTVDIVD